MSKCTLKRCKTYLGDLMKNINVIDLFCGCDGLSYGFDCAGVNILLGIDNDATALKDFDNNHKNAKSICGDITTTTYSDKKSHRR